MKNLSVTTIQTNLHWENADANRAMLEEKISSIPLPTDVIILPEMFSTGFSMNAEALAEPMNFHTFKWMKNMAAKTKALVIGSLIIKENEKYFNRLIWMEPDGDFKTYDKRHLFRMAHEEKVYSPGEQRLVAEWKGWKICPLVCYDLRFPAWSRNQFNKQSKTSDYDLLVYVANWPAARSYHWQTLLKARAIENLSYVVGVNRVGFDGKQIGYEGRSLVIDPKGELLFDGAGAENITTTELNVETLNNWRAKFPAYLDADDFDLK
jgi:predicted amidohydrolase